MLKKIVIISALIAVVALPFLLRPKRAVSGRADETLVIITPHNEAIRSEFGHAFSAWYYQQTGRSISVDWRVIGGTSEITRFLEGEYSASFQLHWTRTLGKAWSTEVQAAFANGKLPADAKPIEKEARAEFQKTEVGCGSDRCCGAGPYEISKQPN